MLTASIQEVRGMQWKGASTIKEPPSSSAHDTNHFTSADMATMMMMRSVGSGYKKAVFVASESARQMKGFGCGSGRSFNGDPGRACRRYDPEKSTLRESRHLPPQVKVSAYISQC